MGKIAIILDSYGDERERVCIIEYRYPTPAPLRKNGAITKIFNSEASEKEREKVLDDILGQYHENALWSHPELISFEIVIEEKTTRCNISKGDLDAILEAVQILPPDKYDRARCRQFAEEFFC